jgi:hypothetical protein
MLNRLPHGPMIGSWNERMTYFEERQHLRQPWLMAVILAIAALDPDSAGHAGQAAR